MSFPHQAVVIRSYHNGLISVVVGYFFCLESFPFKNSSGTLSLFRNRSSDFFFFFGLNFNYVSNKLISLVIQKILGYMEDFLHFILYFLCHKCQE